MDRRDTLSHVARKVGQFQCIGAIEQRPKFMHCRSRYVEFPQESRQGLIGELVVHAKRSENPVKRFCEVNEDDSNGTLGSKKMGTD